MTTTPGDRQILRDWRDTHDDVWRDPNGVACVRWIWTEDGQSVGQCGRTSAWFARGRPLCEAHTVERIRVWTEAEQEVSA